jgi:hypothetical protein
VRQIWAERIPETQKDNVKLDFGALDGEVADGQSGPWSSATVQSVAQL